MLKITGLRIAADPSGIGRSERPQALVHAHVGVDIREQTGLPTHTRESDAALRRVLLEAIEHAPQVITRVERTASVEQGSRLDRGLLPEAKVASLRSEVDLLIGRERDARPLLSGFEVRLDIREELVGEDRHGIACAAVVQERERLHLALRDHQTVAAHEAEDADDELEPRRVIVRVDEVDARGQTTKTLGQGFAFVLLVRQRDHVLGEVRLARLAAVDLLGTTNLPAVIGEGVEVFLGRDELVPLRNVRGGVGGVEDGGEVEVGAHGRRL